jgi:hypothetical protein
MARWDGESRALNLPSLSTFKSVFVAGRQMTAVKQLKQKPETANCIVQHGCFDGISNFFSLNAGPV